MIRQRLGLGPTSRKCRCLIRPITYRHGGPVDVAWHAMELRSLAYFVRIAELWSITPAAAHLHLAQPALTRPVQRLQDQLRVAVLTPAHPGRQLTQAGPQPVPNGP